ncbi:DNA topoisomerase III [Denitratisoma oestradiolicum]|uniref:DNA topoisomerase n=1 Tax=Denitratisoma oestradiolicum TaxID=311182 RepID=A0A6S6Y1T7_9PROT|nr:DNA topoisomerase III [Denitratisoma oestradiolicum]TWO79214.1 DNA topoisomerase III [Denitratisoma oestradiolicum]CAB1370861.1 DNA topoisomerase III [Denitratisoma oestradiolicum]
MTKQLIIAEKPSVAQDIAKALGGFTRQGDYFESDDYVLSSAIGHLLELAVPEEYEVKRGKWTFTHLPVIPPRFTLNPIDRTADRLKLLTRLIKRKDVVALINACDAGREGELIFRYVAQHALGGKGDKPVRRLWLQSMTANAIREGFAHLRSDEEMLPLADAARCRSEADWLVGINGTRAMTAFNSAEGGFYKTPVGRVQTPTLAVLVERENRIRNFISRDYWEVEAEFKCVAGLYRGRWFDEKFRKSEDEHAKAERLWEQSRAEAIRGKCLGKHGAVEEESKPKTEACPMLYDLTSLQREANGRFGFSAKNTLGLAQALYEKHKALTYPRTDSRHLPEDYVATVKETLGNLAETPYGRFAGQILEKGWVHPNKRIFNNAKVSDHFAIIPTGVVPKNLSEPEQKLYDLVMKRFLGIFFPAAEYHVTTRITRVEGEAFKTEGKVLVNAGWLAVYGREAQVKDGEEEENANLPPLEPNERVWANDVEVKGKATQPPPRFSEATLLTAMEGAGKLVEDEELRAAMSERGLGTPATRAATIEGLITEEYVHRNGRELQPTAKAFSLLFALEKLGVDEIRSPELTGEWEYKLKLMEQGKLGRDEFMNHITGKTREMVDRIKHGELPDEAFSTLKTPCPRCGGAIREGYKKFECQGCDYKLWKVVASRQWEPEEMEELLSQGVVGPLQGFRSKMGRAFAAIIKLNDDKMPEFDFGQSNEADGEEVDFSGQETLGACPKCSARVFEHGMSYVCEKSVGPARTCDFRSGKVILQQEITRDEMQKLLAEGRTTLLKGFISARTRRKFSAFLVRGKDGKVGFEFEAKAPKATAAKLAEGEKAAPAAKAAPKKRATSKAGSTKKKVAA